MEKRVDEIVHPYLCQTALQLCMVARKLLMDEESENVSKICSFISTLCSDNTFDLCKEESKLCIKVSELLKDHRSEAYKDATKLCSRARTLCPRNNFISGA